MITSPEQFEREGKRRFGATNPERFRIPHWEWMVRTRTDPYQVRKKLGLEHHYGSGDPDWCFDRFGMTETRMPDGRVICVGGEHEDHYSPDFCIYNDVIVLRPGSDGEVSSESGTIEIYGYPETTFPPTDFHTATLVGDQIYLIGGLGYKESRDTGRTPVFIFDTASYRIRPLKTHGESPGWIYEHLAAYDTSQRAITVRHGFIETEGSDRQVRGQARHKLDTESGQWVRLEE